MSHRDLWHDHKVILKPISVTVDHLQRVEPPFQDEFVFFLDLGSFSTTDYGKTFFYFTCLPRVLLTGKDSQFCCCCWLVEAEYRFGHRANACPLERRDGKEGVRWCWDPRHVPGAHSASLICHFPFFFSLPLNHLVHGISFSFVSGDMDDKKPVSLLTTSDSYLEDG